MASNAVESGVIESDTIELEATLLNRFQPNREDSCATDKAIVKDFSAENTPTNSTAPALAKDSSVYEN